MDLENSFVVPAGIEVAWSKLLDIESVAPCMPGATLTGHKGDSFDGKVKVKLGPVSMTYSGTGQFLERDDQKHRVVIEAAGKDSRGSSTARATVHTQLLAEGPELTRVEVTTDLAITGRPAQFGRGVMQDVAGRIIDQFAANLAALMASDAPETLPEAPPAEAPEDTKATSAPAPANDAIDLIDAAGAPVLKRAIPVVIGVVVLVVVWRILRRGR